MARGYEVREENDTKQYVPSRPARRADSRRRGGGETPVDYQASGSQRGRPDGVVRHHRDLPKHESYTGGHYAESPIVMPAAERTLAIVSSSTHARSTGSINRSSAPGHGRHGGGHRRGSGGSAEEVGSSRRSATLPGGGSERRSKSAASRYPPGSRLPNGGTTVSKVTRSRSLSSRPAGIAVYHPPGSVAGGQEKIPPEAYAIQNKPYTGSRPGTRMSGKSGRSHRSGHDGAMSTATGRNTTKAGVVVETMSAPNPFCPNTRGVCCLMVIVNLALILVAIGFIIVLQLHDPAFVWNIGVVILAFGFFTFFVALVYCTCICQEARHPRPGRPAQGELYWTHHWQKNITIPEIRSRDKERWEEQDRFPEDEERHAAALEAGERGANGGDLSDTSSRDYPRLYLESDYGQRTDREADFETEQEGGGGGGKSGKYSSSGGAGGRDDKGRM